MCFCFLVEFGASVFVGISGMVFFWCHLCRSLWNFPSLNSSWNFHYHQISFSSLKWHSSILINHLFKKGNHDCSSQLPYLIYLVLCNWYVRNHWHDDLSHWGGNQNGNEGKQFPPKVSVFAAVFWCCSNFLVLNSVCGWFFILYTSLVSLHYCFYFTIILILFDSDN